MVEWIIQPSPERQLPFFDGMTPLTGEAARHATPELLEAHHSAFASTIQNEWACAVRMS